MAPRFAADGAPHCRFGRYAAIDIGTVTCRMLVADMGPNGISEVSREYEITNLGEGVDATGELSRAAMERVAKTIKRYLAARDSLSDAQHPVVRTIAVATSAARDARNAAEFAELLRGAGLELSVIPGALEAALSFRGASADFSGERLFVVDVGGGSTEVVAGEGARDALFSRSFNVGCRRMTERFFRSDPPAPDEIERARAWVREQVAPWFSEVWASGFAPERLVAVAGTATTVVSVREGMAVYDASRVHGAAVSRAELDDVCDRLGSMPLEERREVAGLDPARAPVIVAGLVILQEVLAAAGADGFAASESDILHGMVMGAAEGSLA